MTKSSGRSKSPAVTAQLTAEALLAELLPPTPPPAVLYHYCNGASLKGIVESRQLWAGSACFLNDPLEWLWLRRVAVRLLKEKYNPVPPPRRFGARRNGYWELLSRLEEMEGWEHERVGIFIASLSEKHDDLSQWRAYANDAQGYCIGFNTSAFPVNLRKVCYSLEHQRHIVDRLVDHCIGDPRKPKRVYAAEECASLMQRMQPLMKNACYEQEAEWRLVVKGEMIPHFSSGKLSHPKSENIGLRLRGELVVPYLVVPLSPDSIISVTVGPQQPEPGATHFALTLLLARNGFTSADIKVASSIVPYRSK